MGDQDTILSLCDTFGLVQQGKGLKAILVKVKATMEPLAQFAGLAMISVSSVHWTLITIMSISNVIQYDQDWDETM